MAMAETRLIFPEWDLMITMAGLSISGNILPAATMQWHCIYPTVGRIDGPAFLVWKHEKISYYPCLK